MSISIIWATDKGGMDQGGWMEDGVAGSEAGWGMVGQVAKDDWWVAGIGHGNGG